MFFAHYTGGKAVTDLLLAAGASLEAVDDNGRSVDEYALFTEEEYRALDALDGNPIP